MASPNGTGPRADVGTGRVFDVTITPNPYPGRRDPVLMGLVDEAVDELLQRLYGVQRDLEPPEDLVFVTLDTANHRTSWPGRLPADQPDVRINISAVGRTAQPSEIRRDLQVVAQALRLSAGQYYVVITIPAASATAVIRRSGAPATAAELVAGEQVRA